MTNPCSDPMPPPPTNSPVAGNPAPPAAALRCPRCDSANTKFCYYNNYSLSQPRHFCRTCRRYWTKGGSIRNIPIGGGCRKTRKPSRPAAARDLDLFPAGPSLIGLTKFSSPFAVDRGGGSSSSQNMASSIESLSNHNLELHWQLQHQRMSLLYADQPARANNEAAGSATECFLNASYGGGGSGTSNGKEKENNDGIATSGFNDGSSGGWANRDQFHYFNGLV